MSHVRRILCFLLVLHFLKPTTVSAAEPSPELVKFRRDLAFVRDLYTGKRYEALKKDYLKQLTDRDTKAWQANVTSAGDQKRRKSFLAEYFAYSGEVEVVPFDKAVTFPVRTAKKRLQIFVFRPAKSKTKEPLSDKLKNTTYLIVRGNVPLENNPYGVLVGQALRGYTKQEINELVEAYRKRW